MSMSWHDIGYNEGDWLIFDKFFIFFQCLSIALCVFSILPLSFSPLALVLPFFLPSGIFPFQNNINIDLQLRKREKPTQVEPLYFLSHLSWKLHKFLLIECKNIPARFGHVWAKYCAIVHFRSGQQNILRVITQLFRCFLPLFLCQVFWNMSVWLRPDPTLWWIRVCGGGIRPAIIQDSAAAPHPPSRSDWRLVFALKGEEGREGK